MRLTVLGSGSAFSTCGCNAGYLVDGRVLVDCGAPVPALIRRAATSIDAISLILLTHFHADHCFTLPTLLGARAFAGTPTPGALAIAGPVGTREYVSRLLGDGYGSHIQRDGRRQRRPRVRGAAGRQRRRDRRLSGAKPCGGAQHRPVTRVPSHRHRGCLGRVLRRQRAVRRAPPFDRRMRPLRVRVHRMGRPDSRRSSVARRGRGA